MRFVRVRGDPPDAIDADDLREAVAVDGVDLAVLFGSYASDHSGRLSDLDVGVTFEPAIEGPDRSGLLDELTVRIQRATDVEAVDLVDLGAVGPGLGYEALATGVLLHGERETAVDLEAAFLLKALDFQPIKRTWQESLDERLREGRFGRP